MQLKSALYLRYTLRIAVNAWYFYETFVMRYLNATYIPIRYSYLLFS